MLKFLSHLMHLLAEAALGLLAVAVLASCVLAWRLAQGPIDMTWLVRREQALLSRPGTRLTVGGADLAWEGFARSGQPLDFRVRQVALDVPGGPKLQLGEASVGLAEGLLLFGSIAPRSISVRGADLQVQRRADGSLRLGSSVGSSGTPGVPLAWPAQLGRLHVQDAALTVHDAALGVDWHANGVTLDLTHTPGGATSGTGHADLAAGDVGAGVDLQAGPWSGGSHLQVRLLPVNPAALARISPKLAVLAQVNAALTATATADFDWALHPVSGRIDLALGPGTITAGQGSVQVASATAAVSATPSDLHLERARVAFAPLPGSQAAPPVLTATAAATRAAGKVHVAFGVDLDRVPMADLPRYWPPGTGGGARAWLTRNITSGTGRAAHVAGALDTPSDDLSNATITALSGGLALDDATVWWLRPIPPMTHASARMSIDGPDALTVTVQQARQDRLALSAGSSIRITQLEEPHQFGDIDANLAGPLADALGLLDHPRLKLLSRGGFEVVNPAGAAQAHLTMHIPLEDRVTMDEIPISATASLAGVHLGRVAAGRDLDQGNLAVKVTGDGLGIKGHGAIAGIPAKLALTMDFRAGPPGQVIQHLRADGAATPSQLAAAGLPASAVRILTGGSTALQVEYTARRNATASLQLGADFSGASVLTPFGWSKPVGPAASAAGQVRLDHGRLSGVENLRAQGPDLAIASHAVFSPGAARMLVLDRFDVGRTSAHGRIGFPAKPGLPVSITLAGPMLDLSTYFGTPAPKQAPSPDGQDDKPGLPWSAKLDFGQVQLARGKVLAPLSVDAASDGLRILHAAASAGAAGEFTAGVVAGSGRRLVSVAAADAGAVLGALGVADNLQGGSLTLDGVYDDTALGSPLAGTATLTRFNVRDAPAIGRLLQVMTLYGVADTLHGPGLHFSRMVAPFRWRERVLHLSNARAFSSSLGITADGDIDLKHRTADMRGTVVPAYFFNQLLGNLPLIGRAFSPEKGGGVFAARYSVRGPLASPKVGVNPLSALTPGFLRGVFGVFDRARPTAP